MSWRDDPYWLAASAAALGAIDEVDLMFVPTEFLSLHERFFPLEYSWGIVPAGRRVAWCCSKDDAHRLAPWVHERAAERAECAWSNEVFVLCGRVKWSRKASSTSIRHWQAWRQRVQIYRGGVAGPAKFRPAAGSATGTGPKVLLVGASGMGNVGDDLLAEVAADLLKKHVGARVWCSHSDVDPRHLRGFGAVVVGGGGLIYASRDGRNETQNLANYLKFGPMCQGLGLPVVMLGVSDQDHADGLGREAVTLEFARSCLPRFTMATTRDTASSELLARLGTPRVQTGPDLLFGWLPRVQRSVRPARGVGARLAMAGELTGSHFLMEGLRQVGGPLCDAVRQVEIDLLVMSDDDVAHAQRLRNLLVKCGATVAVEDIRGRGFDALVHLFSQYRGLITTRFHGLVLAAICGLPVLALDVRDGKKARLLRALSGDEHLLLSDEPLDAGLARLVAAVAGEISAVPAERVALMARTMSVHVNALRAVAADWAQGVVLQAELDPESAQESVPPRVEPLPPLPEAAQRYRTSSLVQAASDDGGSVGLCWAASTRETSGFGNLGDSLSAVIVCALSGRRVHHVAFEQPQSKLVAVGSIAHAISGGEAIVWGSGVSIRGGWLPRSVPRTRYDVRAVRGQISGQHLRDFGISVPEVYGDPVWFLPSIFNEPVEKKYELGVIPHIQDIDGYGPQARPPADSLRYAIDPADAGQVVLINTWHQASWEGILATMRMILSCKRIVSQSFHGVVIAEAYGIPVLNFRQMPGLGNGAVRMDLRSECTTDPRIWEFYRGGRGTEFPMYAQRRDQRTDWLEVIRAIDRQWVPFDYDAAPLLESFPLPLAHDPRLGRLLDQTKLRKLRF